MTNKLTRKHATLGQYLASTFTHPRTVFTDLVDDPHGRAYATLVLGIVAVLYSLVEWFLYRQHYNPVPPPFLRIPADQYYAWATLFCAPAFVAGWLLTTGAMQLGARALGGHGRFEDLATAIAWATGVATLFTLIPDLTTSALGMYEAYGKTPWSHVSQAVFISLYVIAFGVLYTSALRAVHGLDWRSACVVGLGGFVLLQGFLFLFIR